MPSHRIDVNTGDFALEVLAKALEAAALSEEREHEQEQELLMCVK